jgi:hypothetical protein
LHDVEELPGKKRLRQCHHMPQPPAAPRLRSPPCTLTNPHLATPTKPSKPRYTIIRQKQTRSRNGSIRTRQTPWLLNLSIVIDLFPSRSCPYWPYSGCAGLHNQRFPSEPRGWRLIHFCHDGLCGNVCRHINCLAAKPWLRSAPGKPSWAKCRDGRRDAGVEAGQKTGGG